MIKKCKCGGSPSVKSILPNQIALICDKCKSGTGLYYNIKEAIDAWNYLADKYLLKPIVKTTEESPLRHIKISDPFSNLQYSIDKNIYTITQKVQAQITDLSEKAIVQAIIDFAKEQGYTDLYLIDKEFIISAILHEIERRKNGIQEIDKTIS